MSNAVELLLKARNEASAELNKVNDQLQKVTGTASGFWQMTKAVFVGNHIAQWAERSIGSLSRVAAGFVNAASAAEQMQVRLDRVTRGHGANAFQMLDEWARRMPISTETATQGLIRMRTLGMDPLVADLQTIADTAYAAGGDTNANFARIAEAFGQIAQKGEASGRAIQSLAMGMHLPVYDILSRKLGVTKEQIQDLGKAGIDTREVIQALYTGLAEQFGGESAKFADTWDGKVKQLQETWDDFKRSVMDAGAFDVLKTGLDELGETLKRVDLAGWAREVSRLVVSGFKLAAESVVEFANMVTTAKLVWSSWKFSGASMLGAAQNVLSRPAGLMGEDATASLAGTPGPNAFEAVKDSERERIDGLLDAINGRNARLADLEAKADALAGGWAPGVKAGAATTVQPSNPLKLPGGSGQRYGAGGGIDFSDVDKAGEAAYKEWLKQREKAEADWIDRRFELESDLSRRVRAMSVTEYEERLAQIQDEAKTFEAYGLDAAQYVALERRKLDDEQARYERDLAMQTAELRDQLNRDHMTKYQQRQADVARDVAARIRDIQDRRAEGKLDGATANRMVADLDAYGRAAQDQIAAKAGDNLGRGFGRGLEDWTNQANSWFDSMRAVAADAAQGMAKSFDDFFFDAFTGKLNSLTDYVRAFGQSVLRSLTGQLGGQVTTAILGGLGFGGKRADGGPVYAGEAYVVGERGPELFVPRASGQIVPNGGGAPRVSITVNNNSGTALSARGEAQWNGREYVVNVIVDELRRGNTDLRTALAGGR